MNLKINYVKNLNTNLELLVVEPMVQQQVALERENVKVVNLLKVAKVVKRTKPIILNWSSNVLIHERIF